MSVTGIASATPAFRSRFLEGLAPRDRQIVLAAGNELHFRANSVVVHQSDPADHMFVLTNGRARHFYMTEQGQKLSLYWLTPGEAFGGAALVSRPSPYIVSTETVKDSCVLAWDRKTLRRLVTRYPILIDNTFLIGYDHFDWYVASYKALSCQTARQRLGQVLVSAAQIIGKKVPDGIEVDVTNEELASAANVTPFTVSRALNEWQRNHIVKKLRGKVLLSSPERLSPA
jgi:CRP/FNR family transcriptional regulator, nitrogen oxide reductase regulator